MEKDKVEYLITYHCNLMTEIEADAFKHWRHSFKLENSDFQSSQKKDDFKIAFYKIGWLTKDVETLNLLKDGIELFKERVATRIISEGQINFNDCPQCKKLARTPKAKQCRYCFFDWH